MYVERVGDCKDTRKGVFINLLSSLNRYCVIRTDGCYLCQGRHDNLYWDDCLMFASTFRHIVNARSLALKVVSGTHIVEWLQEGF